METLRVQLEKEKAKKVRELAMKAYGHSKGSISKAMNKALDDWMEKVDAKKTRKWTIDDFVGRASKIKGTSLKVQKEALDIWSKAD